jgi:hypothetical protein
VGLTVGTSPTPDEDASLGFYTARLDWHYALLGAATVAVIIGLLAQAASIARSVDWKLKTDPFRYSALFAVCWRSALALILFSCLFTEILVSRRMVRMPESEAIVTCPVFPDAVWICGILITLLASLMRLRGTKPPKENRQWVNHSIWLLGPILAVLILPDVTLVHFLVHIATRGIEVAQPGALQRVGTFPDHQAEGFQSFWIATAAVAAVIIAAFCLVTINAGTALSRRHKLCCAVSYVAFLSTAATYCFWYYSFEFSRISPDMATGGIAPNWVELSMGVILAFMFVTAASYSLSVAGVNYVPLTTTSADEPYRPALYESGVCLFAFVTSAAISMIEMIRELLSFQSFALLSGFGTGWAILDVVLGLLRYSRGILVMAMAALSIQLWWLRRRRNDTPALEFAALSPGRFARNWIAMALLAAVGLPTIASFCFVFWLGPWYLYGP